MIIISITPRDWKEERITRKRQSICNLLSRWFSWNHFSLFFLFRLGGLFAFYVYSFFCIPAGFADNPFSMAIATHSFHAPLCMIEQLFTFHIPFTFLPIQIRWYSNHNVRLRRKYNLQRLMFECYWRNDDWQKMM